jgi:hypothetical protein
VDGDKVRRKEDWTEAESRAWYAAQRAILSAVRGGASAPRFAGSWVDADGVCLVVAMTGDVHEAERQLRAVARIPVRLVQATRPLAELETLCEVVLTEGERLGALLSAVGVDVVDNCVEVMLEDLDAPASYDLRKRFGDQPVTWTEGSVALATD